MSGGSFEYVCSKLDSEGYEVPLALDELRKMEQFLRASNKHEIADEILRGILRIETALHRLDVVGKYLVDITHAVEWWASGDWGEEAVDKVFKEQYLGDSENA